MPSRLDRHLRFRFPSKTLFTFLTSFLCNYFPFQDHLTLLDFITLQKLGEEFYLWNSSLYNLFALYLIYFKFNYLTSNYVFRHPRINTRTSFWARGSFTLTWKKIQNVTEFFWLVIYVFIRITGTFWITTSVPKYIASIWFGHEAGKVGATGLTGSQEKAGACPNRMLALYNLRG
jgi:hypothetical protein